MGIMLAMAAVLAAAAQSTNDGRALESISYQTQVCYGACPVYLVTVHVDGRGEFAGGPNTAVEGRTVTFSTTPAQFRALADHLEPIRPESGAAGDYMGGGRCQHVGDATSLVVTWRELDGDVQSRCHFTARARQSASGRDINQRMRAIPDMLPIGELIGGDGRGG